MSVALYKTAVDRIARAGEAVTPMYGPVAGGLITNPGTAAGQGIPVVEVLYIDVVGPADVQETTTTIPLQPGQSYAIPPGQTTDVSVNAATAGHRFSGVVYQPPTPYPPTPQSGTFPPSGPTTLTDAIPAYLYEEYADDEDLRAFMAAYNSLIQQYITWFAVVGLGVYTSDAIAGGLLDWVALGLYGMARPSLSSGKNRDVGPLNTYLYNTLAYNKRKKVGPSNVTVTTDDIFKRIMTWNFYKGDGNVFNVRWLKRRIMRFLNGPNGTAPNVDQTYIVSVTYGNGIVSIRISLGTRTITGGALYNRFGFNTTAYNSLKTVFHPGPAIPQYAPILKQALDSGVLLLPFQYTFVMTI